MTLLFVILGSGAMVFVLLRSSRVQTAAVGLFSEQLSRGLNAEVHIDHVSFHFLNRLQLDGLYIGDQQGDTLLWIPRTDVRFNPFALKNDYLNFPLVRVSQPYLNIKQNRTGSNIDFLVRAFRSDTARQEMDMPLQLDQVSVEQARIRYRHMDDGYDMVVCPLDLQLSLPWIAKDSMQAFLDGLTLQAHVSHLNTDIAGAFHGSPDTLFADRLQLHYRQERLFLGQATIVRPLEPDSMQVSAHCQDLMVNRRLLQDLVADLTRQPVRLPEQLASLGDIHYRGWLHGRLDSLTLHGAFLTRLGTVTTECRVSTQTSLDSLRFAGKVGIKRFHVGKMVGNPQLGTLTLSSELNLLYRKDTPLEGQGHIHVDALTFRQYTYRNLRLTGRLHRQGLHGKLVSHDPNLDFALSGKSNLNSDTPFADLKLDLRHLRLSELQLAPKLKGQDMQLRAHLNASSSGNPATIFDHLNGELQIDSLLFIREGQSLLMQSLHLSVHNQTGENSVQLQSDFANAGINGAYHWSTLPATLRRFAFSLFPSLIEQAPEPGHKDDLDFYCYLQNADSLLHVILQSDIDLPERQILKGYIHRSERRQAMQWYIPAVVSRKTELRDITLNALQQDEAASMGLSMLIHPIPSDSVRIHLKDIDFGLFAEAGQDSVLTTCRFGGTKDSVHRSELLTKTHLTRYADYPFVSTHIIPSSFYLRDTLWSVNDSYIEYAAADTTLTVSGFRLQSPSQHIFANGTASTRMTDSIRVELQQVNLNYLLRNFKLERAISADGAITGWATLYSLFSNPMLEANVHMDQGYLNYTLLGTVDAKARLDHDNHQILIDAVARQDERTVVDLQGRVVPQDKYWELYMQLDSADMNLINYWTNRILNNITGRASGNLHVFGRRLNTWVTGRLLGTNASLTVPITGVRYTFTDSVLLDTTAIRFPNIRFHDGQGHHGVLNGEVTHDRFQDFAYDLNMRVSDMKVVQLPYDPQSMFYGTVYATGNVHLFGDEVTGTHIDIDAQSRGKTDFYLNTGTASEATDNSFITFVQPTEEVEEAPVPVTTRHSHRRTENPVYMNLNMSISPGSTIHLRFDPRTGDGIVGQGEGDLRLRYDSPTATAQLYGTYTLQQGEFSYSIGNLIRRDFSINEGSTVTWSGNPMTPVLSVAAKYSLTASLRDLFGSEASQLATNRSSVPVECMVFLSDRLTNPTLRFGIELPQSDESVASQVKSVINTDEMLMRQIIYLLVFNRFFTPEYLQNTALGTNETYSLISSTITGQINSWLSRLTDMVTIGFNFRTDGEGATASQEYETRFRLQPINRLTINGNVGYRYNDLSNRPFFGDVDIEYQLTEDGKLRIKGFTHTVDKYSLKQANTVQGVGLIFRHDFNPGDAERRRRAKAIRKQNEKKE